jgi:hypothetical protein
MAQKRKTDQTKLADRAALLKKIEEKATRDVKRRLGDNWRDNLFEIVMTRMELLAPHKKAFAALPAAFRRDPTALPKFARTFWRTMAQILKTAHVPGGLCQPAYVAAFGVLYLSIIDTFLKDPTKDHAKTMAALDQRLGVFEQVVDFSVCKKRP